MCWRRTALIAPSTQYTILTATGGLGGTTFAGVLPTNLAFLTPSLTYDANNVSYADALVNSGGGSGGGGGGGGGGTTGFGFATVAQTQNQSAVATALDGRRGHQYAHPRATQSDR